MPDQVLPAAPPGPQTLLETHARAFAGLTAAVPGLLRPELADELTGTVARGYLRPAEEDQLFGWFGRFLTVREGLWSLMEECTLALDDNPERLVARPELSVFVIAYGAACAVVTLDRFLVERFARHRLVQRKLNEGSTERRIPRKQFTRIFRSLAEPRNALRMEQAMELVARDRVLVDSLGDDPLVGPVVRSLAELERALDPSRFAFFGLLVRYRLHSLRRRAASLRQRGALALLESGGRTAAEVRDRWSPKRVGPEVVVELAGILRPGDVLVTRHDVAFTNLFLPGYWPHAALYLGEVETGAVGLPGTVEALRTLEALADGVRRRPLATTLAVDAFAVVRPRLPTASIAATLERALAHEGKAYNFDFDFFRSDRLVCTEVVYRAYDGLDGVEIPLRERAGRPTLSAEDLLDLALAGQFFEPVAVFGAPGCATTLTTGSGVAAALAGTYTCVAGTSVA